MRPDISDRLVHFTKGVDPTAAFNQLRTILSEGRLVGGNTHIKGGYRCVCFTEAPLESLPKGFVNSHAYSRYSSFGVMFDKTWIYDHGGRPVIYQGDAEYALLPELLRYRHVRYEPAANPPIDFTWEREWRIRVDELHFSAATAVVVVPERSWYEALLAEHQAGQDAMVEMYSQVIDKKLAEQYREGFPWKVMWWE